MNRIPVLVIGLVLAGAGAAPAQADRKAAPRCPAGKKLASNAAARVVLARRTVVGCAGRHRPVVLRRGVPRGERPLVRLAGTTVVVASGRRARSTSLTRRRPLRSGSFPSAVQAVGLQREGPFAVVAGGKVFKVDGEGRGTLDTGPGVDPATLRVGSSGVSWGPNASRFRIPLYEKAAPGCRRRDGRHRVLGETAVARVVERSGLIVGCRRSDLGRGVRIADNRPDDGDDPFERGSSRGGFAAMGGTAVVLYDQSVDPNGLVASCSIQIVDIAGEFPRTGYGVGDFPGDCGALRVLVTPDGDVGYAITSSYLPRMQPETTSIVGIAVGASEATRLDSGSGIDPKSMTLAGTVLSWSNGGSPRSADLATLPD